jgi:hypothetical protein
MNAALASVRYWRTALSLVGDNPAIAEVAREAEARLRAALDSLHA